MSVKVPTDEQQAIIKHDGNTVVTAKPGSGKTYTIVEKISKILPTLEDFQGVIAISFTNKASLELRQRCHAHGINSKKSFFGTIDKFYISQIIIPFASHLTGVSPDYEVIKEISKDGEFSGLLDATWPLAEQEKVLLENALHEGKIFLNLTGETAMYILEKVPGAMLYIKSRYSHIIIDEYQDCGQIQDLIFTTLVSNGLTGIAVGDFNQAIFGFTNRFPTYLISLISREDFTHFKLSKNHRCHVSISEYSLGLFGASKTIPEDKRIFRVSITGNEEQIAHAIDLRIEAIKTKYEITTNNKIAILCRNKGTIQEIASSLKTPHKIYTDTILDKDNSDWGRLFRDILLSSLGHEIYAMDFAEQFFSEEYDPIKYRSALGLCHRIFSCDETNINGAEDDIIALAELIHPQKRTDTTIQTLHQILNNDDLIKNFLPASENEVNIMTLHKSKGLEFDAVFHMDVYKWIFPNEYGDEDSKIQDLNLHYVGITRAKKVCYIMNGTQRYRSKQDDFISAEPSPFLFIDGLQERRRDVFWYG